MKLKKIDRIAQELETALNDAEIAFRYTGGSSWGSTYLQIAEKAAWDAAEHDWTAMDMDDIMSVRIADHDRQLSGKLNHHAPDRTLDARKSLAEARQEIAEILEWAK